jgi:hypothetical protein
MNTALQSAVSYPDIQQIERLQLPFAKELATHLMLTDYTALIEAAKLENAQNGPSFSLIPYDKPVIPEKYFKAEWNIDRLFTRPCFWCGLSAGEDYPDAPNHFWIASYRAFVRPFSADGIYVMDGTAFEKALEKLHRHCFQEQRAATEEEIGEIYRAQAETMLKISDYTDQYKVPVVVIFRSLSCDELVPLQTP